MKAIKWTRRNKLFGGLGGLAAAMVAVLMVFSFVGMPGGGKLFGTTYAPDWNEPESDYYNRVTLYLGNAYVRKDNESGQDEFALWLDIGRLYMKDRSVISQLGSDKSDKGIWIRKNSNVSQPSTRRSYGL